MSNTESKVQTRSSTNRELYDTISAMFSSDKLDLNALLLKQDIDGPELEKPKETANYLHALLGLNQDVESSTPISALKTKPSAINRPRSVSFSTPEVRDGFSRSTGGLTSESSNSPVSPVRMRSHSSEAGSPTLEQALLMGRDSPGSDAGYGSFQSGTADLNSFADLRRAEEDGSLSPTSRTCDRSFSPGEPRPTLATLVEADLAVAQAAQNLQEMKERQAAIYQGMGVSNTDLKENNILSALLSATQVSKPADYQSAEREDKNKPRTSFIDSLFERDLRDGLDRSFMDRDPLDRTKDPLALERAARQYRNAASIHEANCTWSGQLPPKQAPGRQPSYSSKIFLGGVPWDITETALIQAFMDFGTVRVEWPGREAASPPRGYVYIVFEDEERVKDLLSHCSHDYSNGGSYYFKISSKKRGSKEIQIIPWLVADSNYVSYPSPRLDPKKTVFVGALHGMINAQSLAVIFNDLFGGVVYAGLDTDKHKYPIGSGRVTFANSKSYMKAVAAAFIEIKTPRFCKKVQVDPYLEDALCSMCHMRGPYFCRDLNCFNYYCRNCWDQQHANQVQHKPLMRNIRGLTRARLQDILPNSTECYSPLYQSSRENKLFMDLWGEQDKRSEDNWRAPSLEKADSWRTTDSWRSPPEITWRNQDRGSDFGWSSNCGDSTIGDDFSKLSNVFSDSFSISDRKTGFRSLLDRDASTIRGPIKDTSFRSLEKDCGLLQDHLGLQRDQEDHGVRRLSLQRDQEDPGVRRHTTSLHSLISRDQDGYRPLERGQKVTRSLDCEEDGLRHLLDRDQDGRRVLERDPESRRLLLDRDLSLQSMINRDPVFRPLLERNYEDSTDGLE